MILDSKIPLHINAFKGLPLSVFSPLTSKTSHLLGLNSICHVSVHFHSLGIFWQPSSLSAAPSMLVLSANLLFTYITNNRGSTTDPCGMSLVTDLQPEYLPSTTTLCVIWVCQFRIHTTKSLWILCILISIFKTAQPFHLSVQVPYKCCDCICLN